MNILKYIGYVAAESIILMGMFFVSPTIIGIFNGNKNVWVYIILGITVFAEYVFLFVRRKGRYFSVPLSMVLLLGIVMLYFNSPDNTKSVWAVKAVFSRFVLPMGCVSVLVSLGLWWFDRLKLCREDRL